MQFYQIQLFSKSPTCTEADIKAVRELAAICGIEDFGAVGMEMFRVKSAVAGTPIRELVMRDYKTSGYTMDKIRCWQLEVVDGSVFDEIKDELMADIKKVKKKTIFIRSFTF